MVNNIVLPAEWHRQSFVQLTYPHKNTDWAYMLDEVSACFDEIITTIAKYENVVVVCADEESVSQVSYLISHISYRISQISIPSNDTWARDHAGITIFKNGKPVILDFCFNGWGGKFDAELDNQITRQMFEKGVFAGYEYENHLDFVLEGGSIESDEQGTILTTARCLLEKNRSGLSKTEIERKFNEFFGTKRVLWLHHGYLQGDDTDSHIDTLARFCNENTIAYIKCDDKNDVHYAELTAMEKELHEFKTNDGKPYNLIPLPMTDEIIFDGEKLPATYANFLIINGAVLFPTYNSAKDAIAQKYLQKAFPDRKIEGINCLPLIKQHGSLHCVTMQFPEIFFKNKFLF